MTLATGRLLVEVTGIDGYVSKASKKINQVLSTYQTEAQPEDRVCLALNAFRNHPLNARESVELITPDALNLLVSLKALVFTTVDLFPDLETGADEHEPRTSANRIATYCTPGIVRLRVADAES